MPPYLTSSLIALLLIALVAGALPWLRQRWARRLSLAARVQREDALKHLLKLEAKGQTANLESVAGALQLQPNRIARLLEQMERQDLITHAHGRLSLRPKGRDLALHVIRSHRLWESYLAEKTGSTEASWHPQAERQEHRLTPQQADALAAELGHPTHDPHGDAIPEPGGRLTEEEGMALITAPIETVLRVVHIEDEPQTIYGQLTAAGLRPAMEIVILEKAPHLVRLRAEGRTHVLSPIQANNISVRPLPGTPRDRLPGEQHLAELPTGKQARVIGLSPVCHGQERRRLLDLGFVPGTSISAEMQGPGGSPTAYRLRGTLVALRRDQASYIRITEPEPVLS